MSESSAGPLYGLLDRGAHDGPSRPAVTWGHHTLTYAQLRAASDALAEHLRDARVGAGHRVAIIAPNVPAVVVALFAAWRIGAVAVPLSARLREHDLAAALEIVEPTVVVSVADHHGFSFSDLLATMAHRAALPTVRQVLVVDDLGIVREERANAAPARSSEALGPEVGLLLLTSGTTGAPRAVIVSHARELIGSASLAELIGLTPADTTAMVVPASHAFGLTCLLSAFESGGHAVLVDSTLSAAPMVTAVQEWNAAVLHGSPTLFASLARSAEPPACLRAGFVAGASCPPALIEQLADAGMNLLSLYGMTELGAATAVRVTDPWPTRRDTVGRPLPSYEVRTVDGEVQVRGPHVTAGYFRDPALTEAAFDGSWLRTGDLGAIGADGSLTIAGRSKDLAKIAGFTVAPAETETVLLSHPDVLHAAVVVVPHRTQGEALRAFVVARSGADVTGAALLGFARRQLAGYKLPYALELVAELPLLPSGKPDRVALRSRPPEEREPPRASR